MRKVVVDVDDVATYLAMSPGSVRAMVHRRQIPHFHIGTRLRFDLNEIDRWIDAHVVHAQHGW